MKPTKETRGAGGAGERHLISPYRQFVRCVRFESNLTISEICLPSEIGANQETKTTALEKAMGAGTSAAVKLAASHAAARNAANTTTDQVQTVEGTSETVRIFTGKNKKARAPSTYQLSRWEKKYGTLFDAILKGASGQAPIRLVDAHWLVKAAESRIITHRQALPDAAFLDLSELQTCGNPNGMLPIVCVSYPWLSPTHPDPNGFHVATLAKALRALTSEPADASATLVGYGNTQRYGVFIDYCSLFQHPHPGGGEFRTADQDAKFKAGLSKLGDLYSAPGTNVVRLTELPPEYPSGYNLPDGCNVALYHDRG